MLFLFSFSENFLALSTRGQNLLNSASSIFSSRINTKSGLVGGGGLFVCLFGPQGMWISEAHVLKSWSSSQGGAWGHGLCGRRFPDLKSSPTKVEIREHFLPKQTPFHTPLPRNYDASQLQMPGEVWPKGQNWVLRAPRSGRGCAVGASCAPPGKAWGVAETQGTPLTTEMAPARWYNTGTSQICSTCL